MNEQLQLTVNDVLARSIEALEGGAEWLSGEVPEVINQLLMWHFTQSLASSIFGWAVLVVITLAAIKLPKKAILARANNEGWTRWNNSSHTSTAYDFLSIAPYVIATFAWGITIMVYTTGGGLTWLKILIAPKLYLLEYATRLIN